MQIIRVEASGREGHAEKAGYNHPTVSVREDRGGRPLSTRGWTPRQVAEHASRDSILGEDSTKSLSQDSALSFCPGVHPCSKTLTEKAPIPWSAWVAQPVKRLTSAQVMISVCEFKPCIGLCANSSKPGACFRFCLPLSLGPLPNSCSVSQK